MAELDKIFVTGGTGFLGRHLVPLLVDEGYSLRLLVRPTSDITWLVQAGYKESSWIEMVNGSVNDETSLEKGMQGCSAVVHAAGHFRLWGPFEEFTETNVRGTRQVAIAALRAGIQRMVHLSTVAVVGEPPPGIEINEDTPTTPQDAYQRSKFDAENVLRDLHRTAGLPVILLRPGAFYGPGSRYGFNRLFIEDPWRGLRIQVDRGRHLIFPVFIKDVARAVVLSLQKPDLGQTALHTYNICDQPTTHARVNHIVSDLLGISQWRLNVPRHLVLLMASLMEAWAKRTGREPFYPLNLRHYVFNDWLVSIERARVELGFRPTPLREGLQETIEWYREQRTQSKVR